jgi:hypothetical protein
MFGKVFQFLMLQLAICQDINGVQELFQILEWIITFEMDNENPNHYCECCNGAINIQGCRTKLCNMFKLLVSFLFFSFLSHMFLFEIYIFYFFKPQVYGPWLFYLKLSGIGLVKEH